MERWKKTIDLKGYKEKAKKKINDIFDKTENKKYLVVLMIS